MVHRTDIPQLILADNFNYLKELGQLVLYAHANIHEGPMRARLVKLSETYIRKYCYLQNMNFRSTAVMIMYLYHLMCIVFETMDSSHGLWRRVPRWG